jgi:stearoyl-CoA desaturase (Delta-9 desaturase)
MRSMLVCDHQFSFFGFQFLSRTLMKTYPRILVLGYCLGPVFIIASHIGALIPFITGLSWQAGLWVLFWYLLRMLGITAIYHRLIIHKSYQAHPLVKWIGSVIACSAGQMGPNWWKGHHIQGHHQSSDQPGDSHSPHTPFMGIKGFLWSQGGWLLSRNFLPPSLPPDVESDRVLKTIDRLHFLPLLLLNLLSFKIGGLEFLGACCLSTVILFHGVATVNSLAHLAGDQPFTTEDYSRNNWFVALLTLGEGWHNLHHGFQWSARHGFTVRDRQVVKLIDPTYGFIRLLELLGLASHLKVPSDTELLQAARRVEVLTRPELYPASLK